MQTQKRIEAPKEDPKKQQPQPNKTAGSTGFKYSAYSSPNKQPEEPPEEEVKIERDTSKPQISVMPEEDTEEDLKTYGRLWIWREYLPPDTDKEILEAAEELRKVNVAVRQDLADFYVQVSLKGQTMQKGKVGKKRRNNDDYK